MGTWDNKFAPCMAFAKWLNEPVKERTEEEMAKQREFEVILAVTGSIVYRLKAKNEEEAEDRVCEILGSSLESSSCLWKYDLKYTYGPEAEELKGEK